MEHQYYMHLQGKRWLGRWIMSLQFQCQHWGVLDSSVILLSMTQTVSGYCLSPTGSSYCSPPTQNRWRRWVSHYSWQPQKQGWEISDFIGVLFTPCRISASLPKYFHSFIYLLLPYRLWSEFIANQGQKTQRINCWRNLAPITTVIRQCG